VGAGEPGALRAGVGQAAAPTAPVHQNELVIRIQPDEAVYMKLMSRLPGMEFTPTETELALSYSSRFPAARVPDAYSRLLLDVLRGEQAQFVRDDELAAAWDIFTPLLHAIDGRTGALLWRAFTEAGNTFPPAEFQCADTTCDSSRSQRSPPLLLASGAVVVGGQYSVAAWAAPALPAGTFAPDDVEMPRLVWRVEDFTGREWAWWGGARAAPEGPLFEAFSGIAARDPRDGRLLWRRFGCEVEAALGGRPCCPPPRLEIGFANFANCS
jgi:hypothetical protein